MTCPACDKARAVRFTGEYRSGCWQCVCRGMARSSLAVDAAKTRDSEALKAALAKRLPAVPPESALAAVREWWSLDHMDQQTQGQSA